MSLLIPRRTSSAYLWLVRKIFQTIAKTTFKPAVARDDFSRMRSVMETHGKKAVKGVEVKSDPLAGFEARWFTPKVCKDERIILYCHGGGYCAGSVISHTAPASLYADILQRKLVSFNYRLAPEHAYPAQIEDGIDAYQALLADYKSDQIILMGDSAGGAMILAMAQKIRDMQMDAPHALMAICPWYDFEVNLAKASSVEDKGLSLDIVESFSKNSFQNGTAKEHSLLYTSFKDLPPILLLYGGADTLFAENSALAEVLATDNPKGRSECWADMPHVWPGLHPFIKEAKLSVQHMAEFLDGL